MLCYTAEVSISLCTIIIVTSAQHAEQECNGTDVRLVDGKTELDGSVEICQNGLWVPVCGEKWDYREAQIVCKQLGYNGSESVVTLLFINLLQYAVMQGLTL